MQGFQCPSGVLGLLFSNGSPGVTKVDKESRAREEVHSFTRVDELWVGSA